MVLQVKRFNKLRINDPHNQPVATNERKQTFILGHVFQHYIAIAYICIYLYTVLVMRIYLSYCCFNLFSIALQLFYGYSSSTLYRTLHVCWLDNSRRGKESHDLYSTIQQLTKPALVLSLSNTHPAHYALFSLPDIADTYMLTRTALKAYSLQRSQLTASWATAKAY